MTKQEFILFINILGFQQTWLEKPNLFSFKTDVENNYLNIDIDDNSELFQLKKTKMWSNMQSGKNFGNFSLKTFGNSGDFQLEIFLSFILGSFKKPPHSIVEYMRDRKIENILN
jgi:hypothetical protein